MNIDRMRRYNDAKRPWYVYTSGPELLTEEQVAAMVWTAQAGAEAIRRAFDRATFHHDPLETSGNWDAPGVAKRWHR